MSSPCPHCGNFNNSTDTQCLKCGTRLATTQPLPSVYQAPLSAPPQYYRCPYCSSNFPPQIIQKISAFGWIVFVVGLLFCLIGAFFSLLFKEEVRVCPSCRGHIDNFRPILPPVTAFADNISRPRWNTTHIYIWAGIIVAVILLGTFFAVTRNYNSTEPASIAPS